MTYRHLSHRVLIGFVLSGVSLAVTYGTASAEEPTPAPTAPVPAKVSPKSTAQADAGEPRANTSAASAAPPTTPSSAASAAAGQSKTGGTPKGAAAKSPGAADRVDLGTATVTGDREQPKVMYVVPWKSSDIGDLSGKPMNSLLDEALAPVDRDEFRREVAYFDAVKADRPQNTSANPAAKQVEK